MTDIEELEGTLGTDRLKHFLENSMPLFRENLAELLDTLEQQQWESAACVAHKMRATALIFSTPVFNDGLASIKNQDKALIETENFQRHLKHQADLALENICKKYHIT